MKSIYLIVYLLFGSSLFGYGQVVHPSGAVLVEVQWQSKASRDSPSDELQLDVDNDNVADVIFKDNLYYASGPSSVYYSGNFTIGVVGSGTQLAVDAAEYDSAHRFQAGDLIGDGVRWESNTTRYLSYVISGNGGTGGRGFFRDGNPAYVVIRKQQGAPGNWQYWWVLVNSNRNASGASEVKFYGQSSGVLTAAAGPAVAGIRIGPNPANTGWLLQGSGKYQLFDQQARLLEQGTVQQTKRINCQLLRSGIYHLRFTTAAAPPVWLRLQRE